MLSNKIFHDIFITSGLWPQDTQRNVIKGGIVIKNDISGFYTVSETINHRTLLIEYIFKKLNIPDLRSFQLIYTSDSVCFITITVTDTSKKSSSISLILQETQMNKPRTVIFTESVYGIDTSKIKNISIYCEALHGTFSIHAISAVYKPNNNFRDSFLIQQLSNSKDPSYPSTMTVGESVEMQGKSGKIVRMLNNYPFEKSNRVYINQWDGKFMTKGLIAHSESPSAVNCSYFMTIPYQAGQKYDYLIPYYSSSTTDSIARISISITIGTSITNLTIYELISQDIAIKPGYNYGSISGTIAANPARGIASDAMLVRFMITLKVTDGYVLGLQFLNIVARKDSR
jgi:hypothetical protein